MSTKQKRNHRSTAEEAAELNKKEDFISAKFLSIGTFRVCCEKAGITPTKRQASKFKSQRGKAYAQLALLEAKDRE